MLSENNVQLDAPDGPWFAPKATQEYPCLTIKLEFFEWWDASSNGGWMLKSSYPISWDTNPVGN